MKKFSIVFTILSIIQFMGIMPFLIAQSSGDQAIEMADTFRSEGKIYVVVLVVAIVFTGLIFYAVNTDRKLAKVEKEIKSLKTSDDS